MTGYAYDIDSRHVIAVIEGSDNDEVEAIFDAKFGTPDEVALTYSPAFGCSDGLIATNVPIYRGHA